MIVRSRAAGFAADTAASVGPIFGLTLVTVALASAMAVDFGRVASARASLQMMADSAALAGAAAAIPAGTEQARIAARISYANSELDGIIRTTAPSFQISREVQSDAATIKVVLSASLDTTLGKMIYSSMTLKAQARALIRKSETTTTSGAPICLLALNPTKVEAVKFWGTSDLIAPNCAVQGNSTTSGAFAMGGSATATAAAFCTAAPNYSGSGWSPFPTVNCPAKADPFALKFLPSALSAQGIAVEKPCDTTAEVKPANGASLDASLSGGVYRMCAGLTVMANRTVTLKPGVYVINGPLEVKAGGVLSAPRDVTLYFAKGDSAGLADGYLTVQGGASLSMKAPTFGPLAGMAILAPVNAQGGIVHTLIGGGEITIIGMMYVPNAQVYITGNGSAYQAINASSSYFGIVADTFLMQGNGDIALNGGADSNAHGMPPMPTLTTASTVETRARLIE